MHRILAPLLGTLALSSVALAAPAAPDTAMQTDFLFQLGMMEGHLMVGHELLQAGHPELALPHFGHPTAELYDNIADDLPKLHVAPFNRQLDRLQAAVAAAPRAASTEQLYQTVIATIHQARQAVPAEIRDSVPTEIKICSDTVDAASGEYGEALQGGWTADVTDYHDSRGFLAYVRLETDRLAQRHADPADQTLIQRFSAVLAKAEAIVSPLLPDPKPRATLQQYRAVAAEAAAVAKPH